MERLYSRSEKRDHLLEYIDAVTVFLKESKDVKEVSGYIPVLKSCLLVASKLLADSNVSQSELTELKSSTPAIFYLGKGWEPPLDYCSKNNCFVAAQWFKKLETYEARLAEAKKRLGEIGEY